MEKVWKAEERAKSEESKTKELQQELAEEREMEALRKAHETLTGTTRADCVHFLYSEPLLNEPSAEDYLTGAKYTDKEDENDVKNIRDKPGALWLDHPFPGSDSIQDKRAKIHEDPLFTIRKEEQNQREALKKNPVKMQRLREEILMQKLREGLGKDRKEKRKRKVEKIERKNKRHKLNDGEASAKSLETSPDKGSSGNNSPRDHNRRAEGHDHHDNDRNHHNNDRHYHNNDRNHRDNDRNHHDNNRNHGDNDRNQGSDDRHRRYDDRNHRDNDRNHRDNDRNRRDTRTLPKKETLSSRKKAISEEEKQRRLEEMQRDAESIAKERLERVTKYNEEDAVERVQAISKDGKNDPHFINAMGKDVFSGKETASIADRVKRNIYYIQKTNLDERGLFK